MRINHSYSLSPDDVNDVIHLLHGDGLSEDRRNEFIESLINWQRTRSIQLKTYEFTKKWLEDYARRTGVHLGRHDWDTDEENLVDWVYYQMEYTGGVQWDDELKEVNINKYASSRPMFEENTTQEMLQYLTQEVGNYVATL